MNNKIGAFTKMCCTIGNLPSSYMTSMTYEEQLIWLCNYIEKTLIPAIQGNAEAVEELQNLFNQLQEYVNDYFENLDIQEEINNKLDDMASKGELTDIIAQYLQLAGILAFNTLDDLENAENISEGSFTKTYGKLTYNDGYGAFYKIRALINTDIVDGENLVALTNYPTLVAEKMIDATIDEILTDISNINDSITNINNDINTANGKITSLENYRNYEIENERYSEHFRYYIDGTNGDDTNDGLTSETPFKTLDRFLNEANKRSDIRCYITTAGTYTFTKRVLSNCVVHITSNTANNTDVQIVGDVYQDEGITFYNSHLALDNLTFNDINHIEGCTVIFNNCKFTSSIAFYGGLAQFVNCTIKEFRFNGVNGYINGLTIDNQEKNTSWASPLFFANGSNFEVYGTLTYSNLAVQCANFIRNSNSYLGFRASISFTKVNPSLDYTTFLNSYGVLVINSTQYTNINTNYSFTNQNGLIVKNNTIIPA